MITAIQEHQLPFVWELSLDGVVSHAVGAMHSSPYDFRQQCKELLYGKSALMVEYDIKRESPDLQRVNAPTLNQYLQGFSPADQQFLADVVLEKSLGEMSGKHPIWFMVEMYKKSGVKFNKQGIDLVFLDGASEKNIPAVSLETWETQETYFLAMLNKTPEFLRWIVEKERSESGAAVDFYCRVADTFFSGDENGAWSCTLESPTFDTEVHFKRNHIMAEKSLQYLAHPSLIAVGAAHLIGEHSIFHFYQEKGVTIK